ncbi:MAG: MEDS domain-containing protein [Thaumarchaeota archaeon]|nr:MEDS domain-containing protein [Nitrososphaerota archaeon]
MGVFRPGFVTDHGLIFGFIKDGLEKGEANILITNDPPNEVKAELQEVLDVSVKELEEKGSLRILPSNSVYPPDFQVREVLSSFDEAFKKALDKGFTGLRAVDVTFHGHEPSYVRKLVECDKAYDDLSIGATTLCMYELPQAYDFEVFAKLLLCHSSVVGVKNMPLEEPGKLIPVAVKRTLSEIFGDGGAQTVLAHLSNLRLSYGEEASLDKILEEPTLLRRNLEHIFGWPAETICEQIKKKLAELTVENL